MRYLGGKSRLAQQIAQVVAKLASGSSGRYVEPFVGGGSVLEAVAEREIFRRVEAGDLREDLILMWQALQAGWNPPESVPFEQYEILRKALPSALRGFAGFGASFGGHFFGPYARHTAGVEDDVTVQASRRSVLRQTRAFGKVRFRWRHYEEWLFNPCDVVYCDPPYAGTAGYRGLQKFDHAVFWAWCTQQSLNGARVLVSEFKAPPGWLRVDRVVRESGFNLSEQGDLVDALFMHERLAHLAFD